MTQPTCATIWGEQPRIFLPNLVALQPLSLTRRRKTGFCVPFDVGWSSLRRRQDYYDEGALMWLRADTIIREQTQDRLSLDDFLRSFLGQRDTDPIVVPYNREEVEAVARGNMSAYDWHSFLRDATSTR
jgi:predicted metalloprotease with PDZ domain